MMLRKPSLEDLKALVRADALGFDDGDYRERPEAFFKARVIGVCILAVAALMLPLGSKRFAIAGMLFCYVSAQFVLRAKLTPEYSEGVQLWLAAIVALTAGTILPSILPAVTVAVSGIVVSAAREIGRAAYAVLALSACWLTGIYLVEMTPLGYLPILVFVLISPAPIQYNLWAVGQYELRSQREQILMQSGRAISWEYDQLAGRLRAVAGPTQELLGYSHNEVADLLAGPMNSAMDDGATKPDHEWTLKLTHADGDDRWFRLSAASHARVDGSPVVIGVAIDITEVEAGRLAESRRANRDPLTGLANRSGFAKFLDEAASRVGRAVLLADLNDFKDVNDSLGHVVGDQLITAVAMRLSQLADDNVCVARIGGDEFAVALVASNEVSASTMAEELAGRVVACFASPFSVGGLEMNSSASVGLAAGPSLDWDALLRRADVAMYTSKRSGDPYRWYDASADAGSSNRVRLRRQLERNLESQVVLYYQPIFSADDRRVVSLEALARWEHPEHGIIEPDDFLPLIESSVGAARFDRHIMSMAVRTAAELAALPDGPSLAANLRPASLWSPQLVGELQALLYEYPLAAGRLVLEVTEQGLADDLEDLLPSLLALKEIGVRLAIDDFGTGASSLIRLRALPFDVVKIDRSFVSGVPQDPVDTTIVRSTISLAQDLGMTTVAEGVERAETADALTELGCDKLQGWFFSRALPLDDLIDTYGLARPWPGTVLPAAGIEHDAQVRGNGSLSARDALMAGATQKFDPVIDGRSHRG